MKRIGFLVAGLALIVGVSFAFQSAGAAKPAKGVYKIDEKASSLKWQGDHADGSHSHYGTIKISSGEAKFDGDKFVSGDFKVDMKSMDSELTPEKGESQLLGHLATADFFNTAEFPNVDVKVTSWTENEMGATLTILGKELKTTFPVKTTKTAESMTTTGKFTLDVSSLGIPGFTQNLEAEKESGKTNQYISPKLPFEINLVMKPAKK